MAIRNAQAYKYTIQRRAHLPMLKMPSPLTNLRTLQIKCPCMHRYTSNAHLLPFYRCSSGVQLPFCAQFNVLVIPCKVLSISSTISLASCEDHLERVFSRCHHQLKLARERVGLAHSGPSSTGLVPRGGPPGTISRRYSMCRLGVFILHRVDLIFALLPHPHPHPFPNSDFVIL